MLNRFVETAATGGNSNGVSAQNQSGCLLKSIQHFFLKWIVIEDALLDWKERLMAVSEAHTIGRMYCCPVITCFSPLNQRGHCLVDSQ